MLPDSSGRWWRMVLVIDACCTGKQLTTMPALPLSSCCYALLGIPSNGHTVMGL
jgi:hypothetical protein